MTAPFDARALLAPVTAEEPCGPDLDLAGDPDFLNAVAEADGVLPATFFTRDDDGRQQVFDRATIDFAGQQKKLAAVLDGTRDLRPLALSARLSVLNRDLAGFAGTLSGIAALLAERWDEVHPRGEDGGYALRGAVLQALDDMPTVVLPLQHVPLATHPRLGAVSYRTAMVANGEATARDGEATLDRGAIERALAETDLDALRATCGAVTAIRDEAARIRAVTLDRSGYEGAVALDRVAALAGRMVEMLAPVLSARDPASAPPPAAANPAAAPDESAGGPATVAPSGLVGPVADLKEATAALDAAAHYLHRFEPSSPAEMLVRQAGSLVGKSFVEVLRALVPDHAEQARLALGPDRAFELSFGQLASISDTELALEGSAESQDDEADVIPRVFRADTRADAVELMRQVGLFYRRRDPASPVPLLLDRAAGLVERDFVAILKDVLPSLNARPNEG